jgi:predicted  nucleic acid-binding Zn-ribbon protein
MSQTEAEKTEKKEAMKKLRESRKDTIKATSARVKENRKAVKAIKEQRPQVSPQLKCCGLLPP